MTRLLEDKPFAARDDREFLAEMNELTRWHLAGCPPYRAIWPDFQHAASPEELPFLHVGVFKYLELKTEGVQHERTLLSSATTGAQSSRIVLDGRSAQLQAASSLAVLKELVGEDLRPLLVLDDARALRQRGRINARIAAAMSLKPLASEVYFVIDSQQPTTVNRAALAAVLARNQRILVYGFTWLLWKAWGNGADGGELRRLTAGKTIHFVHSGGWKKLEAEQVSRTEFEAALLWDLSSDSKVIDFYGLVEQVGIIYPLCVRGFRHVPRWAHALVRDPCTLRSVVGVPGLLQLMNVLAWGAPYQSVLTEDVGRIVQGLCPCGWHGPRFDLLGRVPKAEVRGCANV